MTGAPIYRSNEIIPLAKSVGTLVSFAQPQTTAVMQTLTPVYLASHSQIPSQQLSITPQVPTSICTQEYAVQRQYQFTFDTDNLLI